MRITLDKFLGGKLKIYQPTKGYRAGIDSVILAACVKVLKGYNILDVGSGAGVISYCLAYRCKDITVTGIEQNIAYYSLAKKSLKLNYLKSKIIFLNKNFVNINNMESNIIISNPPWFRKNSTYISSNILVSESKIESLNLKLWIKKVSENLVSNGEYYTIFPYNRITELGKILREYFNIIRVYPIASFEKKSPDRAIVYAKKSANQNEFLEYNRIIIHKLDKSFKEHIDNVLKKGISFSLA